MYARAGGLSNKGPQGAWRLTRRDPAHQKKERGTGRRAGLLPVFMLEAEPARRAPTARLFADGARRVLQFLIQPALFVAGQAAAVLRGHVARFLGDHVQPVMQRAALRWRVVA